MQSKDFLSRDWWMFCISAQCICLCQDHFLWAFAAGKNSTLEYFFKSTQSQMHCKLQPWWLYVWKIITVPHYSSWNFSPPHVIFCFCQSLQNVMEKVTSQNPFPKISWENNIQFCDLKEETFISNWRKI